MQYWKVKLVTTDACAIVSMLVTTDVCAIVSMLRRHRCMRYCFYVSRHRCMRYCFYVSRHRCMRCCFYVTFSVIKFILSITMRQFRKICQVAMCRHMAFFSDIWTYNIAYFSANAAKKTMSCHVSSLHQEGKHFDTNIPWRIPLNDPTHNDHFSLIFFSETPIN